MEEPCRRHEEALPIPREPGDRALPGVPIGMAGGGAAQPGALPAALELPFPHARGAPRSRPPWQGPSITPSTSCRWRWRPCPS